jgi:hypothetical protein
MFEGQGADNVVDPALLDEPEVGQGDEKSRTVRALKRAVRSTHSVAVRPL